jgi:hypothetical protein
VSDLADLSPTRYAALIAPAVDRVFAETMTAGRVMGGHEISERFGGPPATGYLVDLRTRLGSPDGVVTAAQFAAVRRYSDLAQARRLLEGQAERGMLEIDTDGAVRATDRGREFVAAVYALHAQVTATLWEGMRARVELLADLAGRALAEAQLPATWAQTTDGHALSAMIHVFEPGVTVRGDKVAPRRLAGPAGPASTPTGVLLLNRLGTLRYHRADAHAAAWQAAGLTAAEIAALSWSDSRRTRIEEETNRAAAAPWRALTPAERVEFLAGLAALPCAPR